MTRSVLQHRSRGLLRYFSTRAAATPSTPSAHALLGLITSEKHDLQAIKLAFKKKALELHPDIRRGTVSDPGAFIQLVAAYEELIAEYSRPANSKTNTHAAAPHHGSQKHPRENSQPPVKQSYQNTGNPHYHVPESELATWRYGVGNWLSGVQSRRGELAHTGATTLPDQLSAAAKARLLLQRYCQDLEGELGMALAHAYLGPRLETKAGVPLPPCFEAEQRCSPDVSMDLLHIVSGRTLLGRVSSAPPNTLLAIAGSNIHNTSGRMHEQLPPQKPGYLNPGIVTSQTVNLTHPVSSSGLQSGVDSSVGSRSNCAGDSATLAETVSATSEDNMPHGTPTLSTEYVLGADVSTAMTSNSAIAVETKGQGISQQAAVKPLPAETLETPTTKTAVQPNCITQAQNSDDSSYTANLRPAHATDPPTASQHLLHSNSGNSTAAGLLLTRHASILQDEGLAPSKLTGHLTTLHQSRTAASDSLEGLACTQLHTPHMPGGINIGQYRKLRAIIDVGRYLTLDERQMWARLQEERAHQEWSHSMDNTHGQGNRYSGSQLGFEVATIGGCKANRRWQQRAAAHHKHTNTQPLVDASDTPIRAQQGDEMEVSQHTHIPKADAGVTVSNPQMTAGPGHANVAEEIQTHVTSNATRQATDVQTGGTMLKSEHNHQDAKLMEISDRVCSTDVQKQGMQSKQHINEEDADAKQGSYSSRAQASHLAPYSSQNVPCHWPFSLETPGAVALYLTYEADPTVVSWAVLEPPYVSYPHTDQQSFIDTGHSCIGAQPKVPAILGNSNSTVIPAASQAVPSFSRQLHTDVDCNNRQAGSERSNCNVRMLQTLSDSRQGSLPQAMPQVSSKHATTPTVSNSLRRVKVYQSGRLVAGLHGDYVFDPKGLPVARVVRGGSLGVHILHVFDYTSRGMRLLCRAHRPMLPPTATWLFPPRCDTHTASSWSFEWSGYQRQDQRGWLDPCIHIFLAAVASYRWEQEQQAAAQQLLSTGRSDSKLLGHSNHKVDLQQYLNHTWTNLRHKLGFW